MQPSKRPAWIILFFVLPVLVNASKIHLDELKLPEGFKAEVYAEGVANARGMALSKNGTLFVGSMREGKVYAITGTPGGKKVLTIARGLDMPAGVALYNGDLYISAVSRILKIRDVENHLYDTPALEVISADFPPDEMHGWKFIRFGPDNKLYVPIGAPCNVCLKGDKRYASIMRMDPDGGGLEIYAVGIRNTVGFDWDPVTGKMWFTDNGRDNMGDNIPPDELNYAPWQGMNFGFPFVHGADIRDPAFWDKRPKDFEFTPPAIQLGPHVAALGMRFYTGKMFPENYNNMIFIAEHGSWNRSKKTGYRVTMVRVKNGKALSYGIFCEGWKQGESAWGRPDDVQVALDGSLLVSDDLAGVIYRIYYTGKRPKGAE
jgi:glucose/arabinose dehydrogenase